MKQNHPNDGRTPTVAQTIENLKALDAPLSNRAFFIGIAYLVEAAEGLRRNPFDDHFDFDRIRGTLQVLKLCFRDELAGRVTDERPL
jgi:hypothetical protein